MTTFAMKIDLLECDVVEYAYMLYLWGGEDNKQCMVNRKRLYLSTYEAFNSLGFL